MWRSLLFIAIFFAACGQKETTVKKEVDRQPKPVLVDTARAIVNDPQVNSKKFADSLFQQVKDSSRYSYQDTWVSVMVGNLFSKNEHDAVVRYMPTDTTYQVLVIHERENQYWDTILSEQVIVDVPEAYDDIVTITDFNGDAIPDLKVVKQFSLIHTYECADLWLFMRNHFIKVKDFDEMVSAEYDPKTNLIYSYQSAGCADMAMAFGVFKIKDEKVITVKTVGCDCCSEDDSCNMSVNNKSFKVPHQQAYRYVPGYYATAVKEKLMLAAQ